MTRSISTTADKMKAPCLSYWEDLFSPDKDVIEDLEDQRAEPEVKNLFHAQLS